jgi:flotillin
MPEFLNPIAIVLIAIALAVLLLMFLFVKNYIKAPPNELAVFTGRKGGKKFVRGGARFMIPGLEQVDWMSFEPFTVPIDVKGVLTKDNVPVSVDGVGLIKFGSSDEVIATAVERWLSTDREEIAAHLQSVLAGIMRNIVAQMTVEELNGNREDFARRVAEEAGSAFTKIGMELDILTLLNIKDDNGYLEALGRKRIAEVKKDADIGEAEAHRDAQIASAEAKRQGDIAQAEADTAIAQANQERDLEFARIAARVQAEQATAEQAGPRARAEAEKAVLIAEADAKRAQVEAEISVETQRAFKAEAAQRADVIIPAEAEKQAALLRAEGERGATIARAEAEAEERKLTGAAEAEARTAAATANLRELEATAAGLLADLKARAEGQREQAEALNSFTQTAAMLLMHEVFLQAQVDMTKAAAEPLGNIDNLTVFDGGNGTGGLSSLLQATPTQLAMLNERCKSLFGFDMAEVFKKFGSSEMNTSSVSANGDTTSSEVPAAV